MSVTSGFFNSVDGDRAYSALEFGRIFDGIIEDGIIRAIGNAFAVSAKSGNTITIGTGRCWFNHVWVYNDTAYTITLSDSSLLLPRYDAVVIEINYTDSVRAGSVTVVEGTAASSPSYPTLSNDDDVYQYPLAYIYRGANTSSVSSSNITDMRGTDDCPYLTTYGDVRLPFDLGVEDDACGWYDPDTGDFNAFRVPTGTAVVANVLSGKTFSNASSDGLTGTMTNNGAVTKTLSCGGSYTIAAGYHNGSGKVTANSLSSQTSATATAAYILSGYTAWVSGSKLTGTMTNKSGTTTSATSSLDSSNSYVKMKIPTTGYYNTSSYLYNTYSSMASTIGLTAAKIKKGNTILGITGTGTYGWTRKNISSYTFYYSSSSYGTDGDVSFTIPSGATSAYVYYSGGSADFSSSGTGSCTCEIYLNDTLKNSRNITSGDSVWRGTMQGSSFSASAGDVVKVSTARSAGTRIVSFMVAEIIYFAS